MTDATNSAQAGPTPTQRVELHLHTQYSAMDGLCDVANAVKMATNMGHAALAITDHEVVHAFPEAALACREAQRDHPGFKVIYGCDVVFKPNSGGPFTCDSEPASRPLPPFRMTLLAKTPNGLKNLYRIISESHTTYNKRSHADKTPAGPRVPQALLEQYREGLLVGSGPEKGALHTALACGCSITHTRSMVPYFDYIELQPIDKNAAGGQTASCVQLSQTLLAWGKAHHLPVVATGNVHYLRAEDSTAYAILQHAQGKEDIEEQPSLFMRSTNEMLAAFPYLDEQDTFDIVVHAPNRIASLIDPDIRPVHHKGFLLPQIENSETLLQHSVWGRARELYGEPLPPIVQERLTQELEIIIPNGHAVLFAAAQKLTLASRQAGYPVITRGSAGGSAVAYFAGITQVNPFPPHYLCPNCLHHEFAGGHEGDSGFDLPPKSCPHCGEPLRGDGHNIPYEHFIGLDGDKKPDFDLNFSDVYQAQAHRHAQELFGEENVFYASNIISLHEGEARQYVQNYFAAQGAALPENNEKTDTLVRLLIGVKKSVRMHPGGLLIAPEGNDIHNYTPVQYPPGGALRDVLSTHFDYRYLHDSLLKLDLLGHEVPTMLHTLEKWTGVPPDNIPMNDARVFSLLRSPAALGVAPDEFGCETGTLSIPELGTPFVRHMMAVAQPENFGDLVKICGLAHGTGTWKGNAEWLLDEGLCTLRELVATRDDVFLYLQKCGVERKRAFAIAEWVRKGQMACGFSPDVEALLRQHGVPDWYINCCCKIRYLFPKAHAVSYLAASMQLMWYKLYHPLAYYAALFTARKSPLEYDVMLQDKDAVRHRIRQMEDAQHKTYKEEDKLSTLWLVHEYLCRGFSFLPAELGKSRASLYEMENGKLRLPYLAIDGIGLHTARLLEKNAEPKENYISIEDFRLRAGRLPYIVIDTLNEAGLLAGLKLRTS